MLFDRAQRDQLQATASFGRLVVLAGIQHCESIVLNVTIFWGSITLGPLVRLLGILEIVSVRDAGELGQARIKNSSLL